MADPTARLRRRLPGARLGDEMRSLAHRLEREVEQPTRAVVSPRDQAALKIVARRDTSRVASCRPNAPLLIRIVRTPFRLETGRGSRVKYLEKGETFEKLDWRAVVAAALADRERLRFTSAARGRPLPFAVRPSAWAVLPPEHEASKPGDER